MVRFTFFFALLLLLTACSQLGGKAKLESKVEGSVPEVPSRFLGSGGANVEITPSESQLVAAGVDPASLSASQGGIQGLPSESDLIFTDPDDVEGSEAAIQDLFGAEPQGWLSSHSEAKNLALIGSKPLLIVFTDSPNAQSGGSPSSARLESELLGRTDFSEWAVENLIRLKLNFNIRKSVDSQKQSLALRQKRYLESLKKRYRVGGFPAMIVVAADGSVVQHVRGYRSGGAEFAWGLLKTGVVISNDRQEKFEENLERKGYRRWTGKNDKKILARLASYREGEILLISPSGVRYETLESNLSRDDRRWIEQEREKREPR